MIAPIKTKIEVKVPVRVDIAGGFSDIPYYLEKYQIDFGEVLNISLPLYINVMAEIGNGEEIIIDMPDLNETISGGLKELAAQEKNNASIMTHNFIQFFNLDAKGLTIKISSSGQIPPASGLGTSSAVGVAIVEALSSLYGLAGINAPEFNFLVEQAMGICGGKQDPYSSYLGGVNYLRFWGPNKSLVEIKHHFDQDSREYQWFLDHAVVYFSGQSRSSGSANARPEEIIEKDPGILSDIAAVAAEANEAIKDFDILRMQTAIARDRENRLRLGGEYYYNDLMWQLCKVAEEYGFAHRACGAGAGGCLLFFGDQDKKQELVSKLEKISGKLIY